MGRILTVRRPMKWTPKNDRDHVCIGPVSEFQRFGEILKKRCAISGMTLLGWNPLSRCIRSSREITVGNAPSFEGEIIFGRGANI
jgi:hypothetical protein